MKINHKKDFLLSIHSSIQNDSLRCDSLITFAKKYINKPYCYGSKVPKCFDCSGFVQFIYSNFNCYLPNVSAQIAIFGKFISFANAKPGDLVFFTGSNAKSETVGHVGIVTKIEKDRIYFIHASVQAGVIESNTEESYYNHRLLFVKRNQL